MKKNVLFVIQNASFPFDRRVSKEAFSLNANGYSVFVLSPASIFDPSPKDNINGIKVFRFKNYLSDGSILGFLTEYSNSLIKIVSWSLFLIVTKNISVIHISNPPDIFWPLAIICKIFRVKFIFDQHDLSPEMFNIRFKNRFLYNILLWNERMTVKFSDSIIVVNSSFKKRLEEKWGFNKKSCSIIYNGPLKRFSPERNDEIIKRYNNLNVILYVGLMTVTDNIEVIIDTAKRIILDYNRKDCCFVLLGDGSVREKLEKEVYELGISGNVIFLGIVDSTTVMEYLYIAKVCIAPDKPNGLNEYLTLIKIFEYMKAKKPFVAFNLLETKNVAQNSGLYAENLEDYINKILYLIDNPVVANQLGGMGYQLVTKKYLWEHSEKELLNLYSNLMN
jgi:glycosyltransferase involved in cell wall biosynthesis